MSQYSQNIVDLDNHNSPWYLLNRMIKPGSLVLDVGCASGYFDEVLTAKGCIVDGVEIDRADAKEARRWCRQVIIGNIESLDLEKKLKDKYDYIIFADVLEHLVDPTSTLEKVKKYLKPKGKILFSIPNMAHMSLRLEMLTGDFSYQDVGLLDRTHLHFYTIQTIKEIVEKAGLHIESLSNTYFNTPKELAEVHLARVGLKISPTFIKMLESPEAITFQYVGSLSTHKPARIVKQLQRKKKIPIQESKDLLIDRLNEKILKLEETIQQKDKDIAKINAHLDSIINSKSWKMARRIASLKPSRHRKKK